MVREDRERSRLRLSARQKNCGDAIAKTLPIESLIEWTRRVSLEFRDTRAQTRKGCVERCCVHWVRETSCERFGERYTRPCRRCMIHKGFTSRLRIIRRTYVLHFFYSRRRCDNTTHLYTLILHVHTDFQPDATISPSSTGSTTELIDNNRRALANVRNLDDRVR